ncbi:hypothetical protein LTR56_004753 [Elasticomyces elasticus]|nr:hypothetical protein LTR56_004753 [Elasticomyces elasticus]KAK3665609.1 hypothetical protein LTR22_003549 [Elasticomyces elasticus]KAK4930353.1 hypothetical protein LTR49_003094 [Elasticomyces elasticus]KAK5768920.1 hypothetical protein LTS12_000980 [Elasticomyces elasticus]
MGLANHSKDLLFTSSGLILVTGSNGHVASNIIVEALALGFRVRGTVRSADKIAMLDKLFNNVNYSSVLVEDFNTPGAFNEAVRGVDAILLTATKLPGPADPNDIVPETIAGTLGILNSALSAPSVKRVVYTGTIPIVFRPGEAYKQDGTTWADDAVAAAWAPPPYLPERAWVNYKAAKDSAERAMFDFVRTKKPHFTVNSVLPCAVFGRIITKPSDTGEWAKSVLNGKIPPFGGNGQWYINMTDVARLHLAAAFDATIVGQRFIASAAPFNWNEMIDVVQKLKPSAQVAPHYAEPNVDMGDNDNAPGAALLNKWWDQGGYTSFEETIRENLVAEL